MSLFRILGGLRAALDRAGKVMNAVAGWLMVACAVLISVDILSRELLKVSLGATLEISTYLLAISIAWGMARALSERHHVRIDLLVTRVPLRLRQFLHLTALAAMVGWSLLLAYGALQILFESYDFGATDRSVYAIPMVLPQGLWSIGVVFFAVFSTVLFAELVMAVTLGLPDHVEGRMGPRTLEEEAREAFEAAGSGTAADR